MWLQVASDGSPALCQSLPCAPRNILSEDAFLVLFTIERFDEARRSDWSHARPRRSYKRMCQHDMTVVPTRKAERRKADLNSPRCWSLSVCFSGAGRREGGAYFAIMGDLGSRGTHDAQRLFIGANHQRRIARPRTSRRKIWAEVSCFGCWAYPFR